MIVNREMCRLQSEHPRVGEGGPTALAHDLHARGRGRGPHSRFSATFLPPRRRHDRTRQPGDHSACKVRLFGTVLVALRLKLVNYH